tara:strand:- start:8403 stop:9461 length:1059 start_codon:yes stop_codon:yes gene_type:complete
MPDRGKNIAQGNYNILPNRRDLRLRKFFSSTETFKQRLRQMTEKDVGPVPEDPREEQIGIVVDINYNVAPTPGGFRYHLNSDSNCPQLTTRYSIIPENGFFGSPTNPLTPSLLDQFLMDAHPYEPFGDIGPVEVGDRIKIISQVGLGPWSPVGLAKEVVQKEAVPPISGRKASNYFKPPTRNTAVPFQLENLDPDDECFKNKGMGRSCAWKKGRVIGKINLEAIPAGAGISWPIRVRPQVATAFKEMVAAAKAGQPSIEIGASSGFRTMKQQQWCKKRKPNLAATPGYSRHQNGVAIDIVNSDKTTTEVYKWLAKNAHKYGFRRTVSYEPWHWVFFGVTVATRTRPAWTGAL